MNCSRAPLLCKTYKFICNMWCVMCHVPDLIFCKILPLWVKGRPTIPHLGSFRPFEWYSKIDPRWQSYVHFILQGLIITFWSLWRFLRRKNYILCLYCKLGPVYGPMNLGSIDDNRPSHCTVWNSLIKVSVLFHFHSAWKKVL